MPHITVKPFDTSVIKEDRYLNTQLLFKANDLDSSDEIIGVEVENEKFLLCLKKSKQNWLLKYDKVTRPIDVNLVKQAIGNISQSLKLDIVNSNINIRKTQTKLANQYEKSIEDFINVEFPFDTVSIEVGFGSGKHLLYQALNNPNRLFIGIEIHTPSAQQVLRQIELQSIKNIWVVNYDARLLLEMMPSNSCSNIFVHFPVPWDKKPHRRVISPSFLDESMRVLKKNGRLELRTDSYKYFWYSLDVFLGENVSKSSLEIRKNESLEVTSKYEARWLKQEKDIYDVFVTSLQNSPKRDFDFDFSFDNIVYKNKVLDKITKKPILFDGFFFHFERVYRVSQSAILLKLTLGSFDRPEQKYIWMDNSMSYYFGSPPVKTLTNYKAHLKIKEYLNV
ncbi:MAG: tRNA (guanosine(46)-N7)-methyltransferase TrmB [Epsilonproteobacteria bacterium]|nr:tRNA (guanosine(46)-N7)-methyltransferase TrmB [Campylobacterota bacterium]